jgi:hypothetical protein
MIIIYFGLGFGCITLAFIGIIFVMLPAEALASTIIVAFGCIGLIYQGIKLNARKSEIYEFGGYSCPKCGNVISTHYHYCVFCGKSVAAWKTW